MRLEQAAVEYLAHLRLERNLSPATVELYGRWLSSLVGYAVAQSISEVGAVDLEILEGFVAAVSQRGVQGSTVRCAGNAVRGLFRWLACEEIIETDPAGLLELPKKSRKLPRVPSTDEVERLIAAPDRSKPNGLRDSAMLEFMFSAGLRISEACGLRLDNVNMEERTLLVFGKGRKERLIPLGERAAALLADYLQHARPALDKTGSAPHVFLSNRGGPLSRQGVWQMLRRHVIAAGIRHVSPHGLRHAAATSMTRGGAGVRDVQVMLGHTSPTTTERYISLDTSDLRSIYDRCFPRA